MNLESFKKQVEKNLVTRVGEKEAKRLMTIYEEDFPEFLQKRFGVVATATAMIMGY